MLTYLRKPHADLASVILRLGLGFLFIMHGYIKLFQPLSWTEVLSPTMQKVVGWTEFTCGILLLIGLLSRLAAIGLIGDMIGAIALVTGAHEFISVGVGPHGFTFAASGFEYNFILIVACLAVLVLGSGWLSLDHLIFDRRRGAAVTTQTAAPGFPRAEERIAPLP
jgi:putative oxidoreductase